MGDARPRHGSALKVYQLLAILLAGWFFGRLPDLLAEVRSEARSIAGFAPSPPAAQPDMAEIAARVATQVAADTVSRLIAAGWGPQQPAPEAAIGGSAAQEIRFVQEVQPQEAAPRDPAPTRLAQFDYSLPEGRPQAVAANPRPASEPPADRRGEDAYRLATDAYSALSTGDRRLAANRFRQALATDPSHPGAEAWEKELRRLTKRFGLSAYTLSRSYGNGDAIAASPVLGASQTGIAATYTVNPLSRHPVSLLARLTAAGAPDGRIDSDTAEAAVGIRVQPLAGIPVAVDIERRIAIGYWARDEWAARIMGGANASARAFGVPIAWEAFGEAGIVGVKTRDLYAGAQVRAATPVFHSSRLSIDGGAGAWAAAQHAWGDTVSRLDIGPSMRIVVHPFPVSAQIDYRLRAAGNTLPGSGPAVTIAGQF